MSLFDAAAVLIVLAAILGYANYRFIGLEVVAVATDAGHLLIGLIAIAIALVLVARAVSVGLPILALSWFRPFTPGAYPVLVWGGLRGDISIALALSLLASDIQVTILTATYVVVIFSVIIQGGTVGMAARYFVGRKAGEADERH